MLLTKHFLKYVSYFLFFFSFICEIETYPNYSSYVIRTAQLSWLEVRMSNGLSSSSTRPLGSWTANESPSPRRTGGSIPTSRACSAHRAHEPFFTRARGLVKKCENLKITSSWARLGSARPMSSWLVNSQARGPSRARPRTISRAHGLKGLEDTNIK